MDTPRISASSYSNTAPLVWSFLYGREHGNVEIILDNAPARSAELLAQDRVDAALVPVIASQFIDGVKLIPDVCVGARTQVRSVCLITDGNDLCDVRSVALDVSSRTSVVLTKIIFREFLGFEPEWRDAKPDIDTMLAESDAALLIGDPALVISNRSAVGGPPSSFRVFDLAELWNDHTSLGFVFAMWMTRKDRIGIDFAAARDEGLSHIDDIVANYRPDVGIEREQMVEYLTKNIQYSLDDGMMKGLKLYLELADKNGLISERRELQFLS